MLELKENREILNEEMERFYGRGARLLCESAVPPGAESKAPGRPEVRGAERERPQTSIVDRIVELFDGEVMDPGPEGGKV
jgi:hypothetical protein